MSNPHLPPPAIIYTRLANVTVLPAAIPGHRLLDQATCLHFAEGQVVVLHHASPQENLRWQALIGETFPIVEHHRRSLLGSRYLTYTLYNRYPPLLSEVTIPMHNPHRDNLQPLTQREREERWRRANTYSGPPKRHPSEPRRWTRWLEVGLLAVIVVAVAALACGYFGAAAVTTSPTDFHRAEAL